MKYPVILAVACLWLICHIAAGQVSDYTLQTDLRVPMRDGQTLRANVAIPAGVTRGDVLLIIDCYPTPEDPARLYQLVTGTGFIAVHVYNRGLGKSDGVFVPFVNDAQDNYDVIDWISRQPWCSGRVGMGGGSYLGFAQWAAAKNLHPALKAIAPIAAVGPGIDFPMSHGIFLTYTLQWLNYTTNGPYADFASFEDNEKWLSFFNDAYRKSIPFRQYDQHDHHAMPAFQEMLKHPQYDAYWTRMIPAPEDYQKLDIPVLTMTGYFDSDQRGAMHYYNNHMRYGKPENTRKHLLVMGPYTHRGVVSGAVDTLIYGQNVEKAARISMRRLTLGWYRHLLAEQPLPEILKDRVNCFVMGSGWRHAADLQALAPDTALFHLKAGSRDLHTLSTRAPKRKSLVLSFDPRVVQDTFHVAELADAYKNDSWQKPIQEDYIHDVQQLIFDSAPLTRDFELIGSPVVNLQLHVKTLKDCDLDIELYEVSPDKRSFPLSGQVMRLSHMADPAHRQLLTEGQHYSLACSDMTFIAKRIAAGSTIRLVVKVLNSAAFQKNFGSGKSVSDETIGDATPGEIYISLGNPGGSTLSLPGAQK